MLSLHCKAVYGETSIAYFFIILIAQPERRRSNNSYRIKHPLARKHRKSLSPSPLCWKQVELVPKWQTSVQKIFYFSFNFFLMSFFRTQVSVGHRYDTALDFLFLPNDWSSDISPNPQIILLHPLLAPQSSHLSPQFSDKTLFLECNARCTGTSVPPVCVWFLITLSLSLCPRSAVLLTSLCFSPHLWISLSILISTFLSANVALCKERLLP